MLYTCKVSGQIRPRLANQGFSLAAWPKGCDAIATACVHLNVCPQQMVYVIVYNHTHVYMCIYIYIERERDR